MLDDAQTVTEQGKQGSNENGSGRPESADDRAGSKPRESGALDLRDVDHDALKVVRKLLAAGYEAYLVGGCVRDLYLNRRPKDFDVATSARPEQIRRVFRNSRIIGRRFKLAHVFFGQKIIETSTFRANPNTEDDASSEEDLLITHDNEWGSVEEDARRRDFTINGLFHDVERNAIVDFVEGVADLDRGVIRTIGEPAVRFREDPVRMIRAIKFAARLDFTIEPDTWAALLECVPDIARCSRARLVEELYKLLRGGSARRAFELMMQAQLFGYIWPDYVALFEPYGGLRRPVSGEPAQPGPPGLFWRYLQALDDYVSETGQTPSNPVIQTVLFAPLLDEQLLTSNRSDLDGEIDDLMTPPCAALGVARRDRELARQIFMAHRRMVAPNRRRGRKSSLVQRQYFHDALLFLGFTVEVREQEGGALEHWQALANLGSDRGAERGPADGSGRGSGEGEGGGRPGGKRRRGGRRRGKSGGKRSGGKQGAAATASREG